jgi:hypothetical protein
MSETLLARFNHHWEAEMARGYLEDAGVPSRLVSDNLAGGYTYMGNLSGASLLVATERVDEAYRVLADAGLVEPPEGARDEAGDPSRVVEEPLPPALRAERADLVEELRAARKAEMRHLVWCMIGLTPAAVIPFVGLAIEGNVALMALLCVLVVFVEGWRWIRSGRSVRALEAQLARLDGDDGI